MPDIGSLFTRTRSPDQWAYLENNVFLKILHLWTANVQMKFPKKPVITNRIWDGDIVEMVVDRDSSARMKTNSRTEYQSSLALVLKDLLSQQVPPAAHVFAPGFQAFSIVQLTMSRQLKESDWGFIL